MNGENHSRTHPVGDRFRALASVALLLCLAAPASADEVNPEPPPSPRRVNELFAKVDSTDFNVAYRAATQLHYDVTPKDLLAVVRKANGGNRKEREVAFQLLRLRFHPDKTYADELNRLVVPAILDGLRDSDADLRVLVMETAGQYVNHSRQLVDRIIELLGDRERCRSGRPLGELAIQTLCRAAETDRRVLPLMWQLASEGDKRRKALEWLGTLGRIDKRAPYAVMPLLGTVLLNPKEEASIRVAAASGLRWLGPNARPAHPLLIRALRDPRTSNADDAVRIKFVCMIAIQEACKGDEKAKWKGEPERFKDAVPELVEVAARDWPEVRDKYHPPRTCREKALDTLEVMGPAAKAALPGLRKILQDLPKRETHLRDRVLQTIGAISKEK